MVNVFMTRIRKRTEKSGHKGEETVLFLLSWFLTPLQLPLFVPEVPSPSPFITLAIQGPPNNNHKVTYIVGVSSVPNIVQGRPKWQGKTIPMR